MRKSPLSKPVIVHILRQAEVGEKSISHLCRDQGISENTFYRWRRRHGGMGLPELQRQRHREQENARLKRLLAERDLEVDALRELLAKRSRPWRTARRRSPSCEGGGSPTRQA